jgi:metal-responsive CopG/Arc/MetJ family transcriptional regulator
MNPTTKRKERQSPIPVCLPPTMVSWVESVADERGVSRSEVFREAVGVYRSQIEGANQ